MADTLKLVKKISVALKATEQLTRCGRSTFEFVAAFGRYKNLYGSLTNG